MPVNTSLDLTSTMLLFLSFASLHSSSGFCQETNKSSELLDAPRQRENLSRLVVAMPLCHPILLIYLQMIYAQGSQRVLGLGGH